MRYSPSVFVGLLLVAAASAVSPTNPGDLNNDNEVDMFDIFIIQGQLGISPLTDGRADPNNDGTTNIFDIIAVAQHWGIDYNGPAAPSLFNGPNLPNGYTPVVFRQFDTKAASSSDRGTGSFPSKTTGSEGWDGVEFNKPNLQIHSSGYNGTAPLSPPNAMRWTYPLSQPLGSSPGTAQSLTWTGAGNCDSCPRNSKSLYIHYVFQVSPNFYGATDNGVNKMLFQQGIANNFLVLKGKGTGALQLQVNAQGSGGGTFGPKGSWNVSGQAVGYATGNTGASTAIQRGHWYEVEWLEEAGTFGASDGRVRVWIDGVLTHDYQNIEIYAQDGTNNANSVFNAIQISPTYGSTTSETLGSIGGTAEQYLYVDALNVWALP